MGYVPLQAVKVWVQKVLPLVYEDSLSYYELLGKMLEYFNTMIDNQDYMYELIGDHEIRIQDLRKDAEFLKSEMEKVKNGDYLSLYLDSLENWIDKNLQELVGKVVKYVFFGINEDGYFIAYIPDSWEFIEFDTIMDGGEMHGHLVLMW